MGEGARSGLQRWRVPLGFLAVILFLVLSKPSWVLIGAGLPIALTGLGIRAWASGHLRKNTSLAVSGPYAFSRNPLYLGSLIMLAGALVSGGSLLLGAGLLGVFLLVYYPVMSREALHMKELFGDEYDRWATAVPLFLPRLIPFSSASADRFSMDLYLKHREYRALLGVVFIYSVLMMKVMWGATS